jgi:hypothetical protein
MSYYPPSIRPNGFIEKENLHCEYSGLPSPQAYITPLLELNKMLKIESGDDSNTESKRLTPIINKDKNNE